SPSRWPQSGKKREQPAQAGWQDSDGERGTGSSRADRIGSMRARNCVSRRPPQPAYANNRCIGSSVAMSICQLQRPVLLSPAFNHRGLIMKRAFASLAAAAIAVSFSLAQPTLAEDLIVATDTAF